MAKMTIAAVGDLLMKRTIIQAARRTGSDSYSFAPLFAGVAPYLRKADLTIGNLETTFSGRDPSGRYERRSRRTGNPLFNCPDELAGDLKRAGFDVLTTANNHSMDGGASGLRRTLAVLDRHGIRHTGTSRSAQESRRYLIVRAKGIRVGILSYTTGTNSIPVPKPWLVNRIRTGRILADMAYLRKRTDLLVVCLHFGLEYHRVPNARQKRLVRLLFKHGAHVILGAHPHVLQPVVFRKTTDIRGELRHRVAAYSLGNFVSTRLKKNPHTIRAMILRITVVKNRRGISDIVRIARTPTQVRRVRMKGRTAFRVVPAQH
ncbi:CapA family protein [Paenibacillus thermoaerophilus]|nr:CapA family protein [Paenibacillus thermoaerophilus]